MDRTKGLHPMRVVIRRTGLRADLIRAWERRYGVIKPERTETNRRLYSEEDIDRLLLIRRALDLGFHIGNVAGLPNHQIEQMVSDVPAEPVRSAPGSGDRASFHVSSCLECISLLDAEGLQKRLEAASVELSRVDLLEKMLVPLMYEVGERWQDGRFRIAHEHLASTVVRSFVDSLRAAYPASADSPAILVTTPESQHHELAPMVVAATARAEGWRATFLGPNLPVEEIAAAAEQTEANAVALSLTIASGDQAQIEDLRRLGRLLPDDVVIVVGGRALDSYDEVLSDIGARSVQDLTQFRALLHELRGAS